VDEAQRLFSQLVGNDPNVNVRAFGDRSCRSPPPALFMSWLWAISYSKNANQQPVGIVTLVAPFVASLFVLLTFGAATIVVSARNSNTNLIKERNRFASADDIFVTVT
jgi:hypothetical protein